MEELFISTPTAQMVPAPGNLVRWFLTFIPEWFGSLEKQGRSFPRKHFLPILGMWMVPCGNAGLVDLADLLFMELQEGSVGHSVGHWEGQGPSAGGSYGNIWEWWL